MSKRTNRTTILCLAIALAAVTNTGASDAGFHSAFERLKSLVGTWEVVDSESRAEVRYFLTGDGSAVVEVFRGMSSVYHMDGDALRATHYCGANNQPRFEAASYDREAGVLDFDFIDVTNLKAADAYYTNDIRIRFITDDEVEIRFDGLDGGKPAPVTQRLRRK